jgi:hypothetical protein
MLLSKDKWIEKLEPYKTLITVVKGNTLRSLYLQHKESLFAWNIRGYLGSRGINSNIIDTAENKSGDFFYFNNGVSAICTSYDIADDNNLIAENFQVINGAQTIGALAKADPNKDIDVLFRLTKAASVKTEKGMNVDIIRYNNSQNIIKSSDFHSNDHIQIWLEKAFNEGTPTDSVPKIKYIRRRGPTKKGPGKQIKLEDLAKIRYAFLHEPTRIHSSPKDLWTPECEHGVYEKAFGVDGKMPEMWSGEELSRCLLALAFYLNIEEEIKKDKESGRIFKRLRFHALSLAGHYCRAISCSPDNILDNKSEFHKIWDPFWTECRRMLIDTQETLRDQDITFHSFLRSNERWSNMLRRFLKYTKLAAP